MSRSVYWFLLTNLMLTLYQKELSRVRIQAKLLAHSEQQYSKDHRLSRLLPVESIMHEAGRLAYDRGYEHGISKITFNDQPDDPELADDLPEECLTLSFRVAGSELLLEFACGLNDKLIASSVLALRFDRVREALSDYLEHMVQDFSGEQNLRVIAYSDAQRVYNHEKTASAIFGHYPLGIVTNNGTVSILNGTQRNIISVIGRLFPKGPFETLLMRDEAAIPPIRQGLIYRDQYAVFSHDTFPFA